LRVQVIVHPLFQPLIGGQETVEVEGRKVKECLAALVQRYPAMKEALFDRRGRLRSWVEIYCNDKSTYPEELDYAVADGDQLRSIPVAIGGG